MNKEETERKAEEAAAHKMKAEKDYLLAMISAETDSAKLHAWVLIMTNAPVSVVPGPQAVRAAPTPERAKNYRRGNGLSAVTNKYFDMQPEGQKLEEAHAAMRDAGMISASITP